MHWLKRAVVCLCLICSFFFKARAQDVEATFKFASGLYEKGEYDGAIKYYERVIFFSNTYKRLECYISLGNCFQSLNDIENANNYYELAYFATDNDSLKNELVFSRTANLIIQKQFLFAQQELLNVTPRNKKEENRENFYLGIIYFGQQDFGQAKEYFLKAISDKDSVNIQKINSLFVKNERLKRIHPGMAKVLSIIVPGMGQFYAGDVRDGINSLLLTSAFLLLGVEVAVNYSFVDAIGSVFPWYVRYYEGGYQKAAVIAKNRVEYKRSKIYRQIIDALQNASQKS